MSRLTKRIAVILFTLFVAGGLAFGGSQAFATTGASMCDAGTCPPKNNATCNIACLQLRYFGGACAPGGCCLCLM